MAIEWNAEAMHKEIKEILAQHADELDDVTPRAVRFQLEQRLGFAKDELEPRKKEIAAAIKATLDEMSTSGVKAEIAASPTAATPSFSSLSAPAAATPRTVEAQRQLNASKKRALSAAAGDDEADEEESSSKRPKPAAASSSTSSAAAGNGGSSDPNTVFLGGSKRIQVSKFKSFVLVDIRETYTDKTSGEERPGKKGISLKPEQWELLLKHAGKINAAIARMQ